MSRLRLDDWNDLRLLLACIEHGGFSRAALALGIDQATVSRRIGALEAAVGRPLFTRRRAGAKPTTAGAILAEQAAEIAAEVQQFEKLLAGLVSAPAAPVRIAAGEGIVSYLLTPGLLDAGYGPLKYQGQSDCLPPLAFVDPSAQEADIWVLGLAPGDTPPVSSATKVRRIGTMRFAPVASGSYLQGRSVPETFEDLADHPLLDLSLHHSQPGLAAWNELVSGRDKGTEWTFSSTSAAHQGVAAGRGVALLPCYSPLYDERLQVIAISSAPPMVVEIWIAAHEDSLRDRSVREVYDGIARMFIASTWFR